MRVAWRLLQLLVLPTVGLAVAFALAPDRVELETHIWLLVVLGLSVVALLQIVHKTDASKAVIAHNSTPRPSPIVPAAGGVR